MGPTPEAPVKVELPVWVGGCEKWVNGVTKRTTCDDVIYALLRHEGNVSDFIDVSCYTIYERWRKVERPLKGRTKLLKVWRAWGAESRNVKFFVRKSESSMDSSCEFANYKHRKPRRHHHHSSHHSKSVTRDKGNCRHKDTHLKQCSRRRPETANSQSGKGLESTRRDKYSPCLYGDIKAEKWSNLCDSKDVVNDCQTISGQITSSQDSQPFDFHSDKPESSEAFHQLVHTILKQERQIREQMERMRETDALVENFETKMHLVRMRENGQNYVQDAYLKDSSDGNSSSGEESKMKDTQAYLDVYEHVLQLQNRISTEEAKIDDLSAIIFERSHMDTTLSGNERYLECPSKSVRWKDHYPERDDHVTDRINKLKAELERAVSMGKAQEKQLFELDETLGSCHEQLEHKRLYADQLLSQLQRLEALSNTDSTENNWEQQCIHPGTEASHDVASYRPSEMKLTRPEPAQNDPGSGLHALPEIENLSICRNSHYPPEQTSPEHNSDSGVESPGKSESDGSEQLDCLSLRNSQHSRSEPLESENRDALRGYDLEHHIPAADCKQKLQIKGKVMIPYMTYTTYDRSHQRARNDLRYASTPCLVSRLADISEYIRDGQDFAEDSNSDTGLSSLHSDDQAPILETLV